MLELIRAGGWLMLPITLCSIVALAIILERSWALRRTVLMPPQHSVTALWSLHCHTPLNTATLTTLNTSALGRLLAVGLQYHTEPRDVIKEHMQHTGRQSVADMERWLDTLGTIAAITPLLGLLGTVIGMMDVFGVMSHTAERSPELLAGGIATALITTAAGLSVAVPSLFFQRYFNSRIQRVVIDMETQALQLIALLTAPQVSTE